MMCSGCSCESDAQRALCRVCGRPLSFGAQEASSKRDADRGLFDARIAGIEERVAALTQTFLTSALEDPGLPEASIRPADPDLPAPAPTFEPPVGSIDVGALRVMVGGRHGASIETSTEFRRDTTPLGPTEKPGEPPRVDARPHCTIAVWDAFTRGSSMVRIAGARGAGATTLLRIIAAEALAHGYGDVILLTDVRGPARDVAQRLAATRGGTEPSRYHSATALMRLFDGVRALVLLDRAALSSADAADLQALFPSLHFVVAQGAAVAQTPTIAFGPLTADAALMLFEASSGRPIDRENRRVALDIGASVGLLPGPTRLVGATARTLGRSFISLRVQYDSGNAIVSALIASFSPTDRGVLSALALARGPVAAHHIAYVVGGADVRASLERLVDAELVCAADAHTYECSSYVEQLAPLVSASQTDMMFLRFADVFCDALDPSSRVALTDRQVACAEAFVQTAFERSQWDCVVAMGPRLAQACAVRGAFGAWGRVLGFVEAASTHVGDTPTRMLACHDLGVRSLLLGERAEAARFLRAVVRERKNSGDEAGAEASRAVLALAEYRATVPEPVPQPAQARRRSGSRELSAARLTRSRARVGPVSLFLLGLGMVAAVTLAVWFGNRPAATLAFTEFSSNTATLVAGSATNVCVAATNAAVVEIFPDAVRLPGAGTHCVTVHPTATTRYVAVASAVDGRQVRRTLLLDVREAAAVRHLRIAAFSATPARLEAGHTTRLCYAVTGANELRIVPLVGNLTRLRSCRSVTLQRSQRYEYKLLATGDNGQIAVRRVRVDVVTPKPSRRSGAGHALTERALREAIYQFDATPRIVQRGQATSLCVGVDRPARGYVSHVGRLASGVTRCYRVAPRTTTVYRLYVALQQAVAVKTITVTVRPPFRRNAPFRRHDAGASNMRT